eukprot:Gb_27319 [translate_table: standard]
MGIAILPAQDCLAYKGKHSRHSTGMLYHHFNSLQAGCESVQTKRKSVGGSPDFARRKTDPQVNTGSHDFASKRPNSRIVRHSSNFLSSDALRFYPSPTVSVKSDNISILSRPGSTPPILNNGACFGESFSIFYGQQSFSSYSSMHSSAQKFGNNMQQTVSAMHDMQDAKYNTMGSIAHLVVKGRRATLQGNIPVSSDLENRRLFKPKGHGKSQTEVAEKGEGHTGARKEAMFGRKTAEQPSKHIVMEKVTILKRGETIKNVVGKEPEAEWQARQKPLPISNDRLVVHTVETQPSNLKRNKPVWPSKLVPKVSCDETKTNQAAKYQECDGGSLHKTIDNLIITSTERLGPDPSVLPKEGSGILRSASTGMKVSEATMGNDLSIMMKEFQSVSSFESDCLKVGRPPNSDNQKGSASPVFELEKWAGPAYSNSPPPSSLPYPKFSMQQVRSIGMDPIDAESSFDSVELPMTSAPQLSNQDNVVSPALPVTQSCGQLLLCIYLEQVKIETYRLSMIQMVELQVAAYVVSRYGHVCNDAWDSSDSSGGASSYNIYCNQLVASEPRVLHFGWRKCYCYMIQMFDGNSELPASQDICWKQLTFGARGQKLLDCTCLSKAFGIWVAWLSTYVVEVPGMWQETIDMKGTSFVSVLKINQKFISAQDEAWTGHFFCLGTVLMLNRAQWEKRVHCKLHISEHALEGSIS